MPRYYDPVRMHADACGLPHSNPVVYLCSMRSRIRSSFGAERFKLVEPVCHRSASGRPRIC
jgi:hypothetical protein